MKVKKLILTLTVFCLCFTFSSCDSKEVISLTSIGGADFTITNVTTGEQIDGAGLTIGTSGYLTVHQGDVLRLSYTPSSEYSEYTWKVSYDLFDETFTVYSPFTMDYVVENIEPGDYLISCKGVIEDDSVDFRGSDNASAYINVID